MSSSCQREQPWATISLGRAGGSSATQHCWMGGLWVNSARGLLGVRKGVTCVLRPSWIGYKFRSAALFSKGVCPAIQLTCWGWVCVHQMDLQCSARDCSDRQWCNQACTGKYLREHSQKRCRSLCDESQLTPLLTPRKENFTICNPKPTLFLIHGRLLAHFFFSSWWMVDL